MLDHEQPEREVVPDRRERADELVRLGLVQAGGRLVEQQERRPRRERPRDPEAALLAVRQPAGRPVAAILEAQSREQLAGQARAPRASRPRRSAAASTFSNTLRPENRRTSWKVRTRPARAISADVQRRDLLAAEHDGAGRRPLEAGEHVDERRLAGAVRADQPEDLALPQLEVDAVERLDAADVHADVSRLEKRLAPRPCAPAVAR